MRYGAKDVATVIIVIGKGLKIDKGEDVTIDREKNTCQVTNSNSIAVAVVCVLAD